MVFLILLLYIENRNIENIMLIKLDLVLRVN